MRHPRDASTSAAGGSTFEVAIDVTVTATVTIDGDTMTTEYDSGGQVSTVTSTRVD